MLYPNMRVVASIKQFDFKFENCRKLKMTELAENVGELKRLRSRGKFLRRLLPK